MTNTLTIVTAARKIIADPDMWYKGDYTPSGKWDTDEPCCAIKRAAYVIDVDPLDVLRGIMAFTPDQVVICDFNDADSTTHADVLAVFNRAIAALEVNS